MSICHCMISGLDLEDGKTTIKGLKIGMIKKAFKYKLYDLSKYNLYSKDNDLNHIMDMSDFFARNKEICVSDVTGKSYCIWLRMLINFEIDGQKVQIKISEYDPRIVKKIRKMSGFDD